MRFGDTALQPLGVSLVDPLHLRIDAAAFVPDPGLPMVSYAGCYPAWKGENGTTVAGFTVPLVPG